MQVDQSDMLGQEPLAFQMTNGVYVDPLDSEDDEDERSLSPRSRLARTLSSPSMGPRSLASPTMPTLKSPNSTSNLPDAIMAAFQKLAPGTPRGNDLEKSVSVPSMGEPPMYIDDLDASSGCYEICRTSMSVFVNPPLAPPAFANLNLCENCKIEVGTLLSKPRHHCRNCGGTFCQACSSKMSVIPYEPLVSKADFRVCDSCFLRIREFQSQTGTSQCTWNGLPPMHEDEFLAKYDLDDSNTPVVIFSCCYFPECVPYYGHMYFTRGHAYKSSLDPICIPLDDIVAVVKPEFYFINALQLKCKDKAWFFAEFNGHRDMAYVRLDQLMSAHRQFKENEHTPEVLKEMASQRRQSYLNLARRNSILKEDDDFVPLPPDETLPKMTKILDCEMQSDVQTLFDVLLSDTKGRTFYRKYMESTNDKDISIGDWQPMESCPRDAMSKLCVSKDTFAQYRKVESKHPPKVTFPGLPQFAECTRHQVCRHETTDGDEKSWTRFIVAETLRMKKIPYADYFEIETRWVFTRDGRKFCHAEVGILVHFIKSTWFNNQINSSTISETKDAFEIWANQAMAQLRLHSPTATPPKQVAEAKKFPSDSIDDLMAKEETPVAPPTATSAPLPTAAAATSSSSSPLHSILQQPLWVFTVLACLYMLYSIHAMNTTMREVLKRMETLDKVVARVPEQVEELLERQNA
ncbi:unnamed protein product [Aphanomyces euteiches]